MNWISILLLFNEPQSYPWMIESGTIFNGFELFESNWPFCHFRFQGRNAHSLRQTVAQMASRVALGQEPGAKSKLINFYDSTQCNMSCNFRH